MSDNEALLAALLRRIITEARGGDGFSSHYVHLMPAEINEFAGEFDMMPPRITFDSTWELSPDEYRALEPIWEQRHV